MTLFRLGVLLLGLSAGTALADDCAGKTSSIAVQMFVAAPEMRQSNELPSLGCTLAQEVIARARAQASVSTAAAMTSAVGYVPKTKDDNTPWRFDMNQNGRRMTAEEFDAWMKAKGIHVATGRPAATAVSDSAPSPSAGASTP